MSEHLPPTDAPYGTPPPIAQVATPGPVPGGYMPQQGYSPQQTWYPPQGYPQPSFHPLMSAPSGQPGYFQPQAYAYQPNPFDSRGSTVQGWGIASLVVGFLCGIGFFVGPVAWVMGNNVKRDANAAGFEEPGNNKAGRICGIISTVILALNIVLIVGSLILLFGGLMTL
jgi:hypothetical protein